MKSNSHLECQICHKSMATGYVVPAKFVRSGIVDLIRSEYPDWSSDGYICHDDLNRYRSQYVQNALWDEKGELSELELEVIRSLKEHDVLAQNINLTAKGDFTFGERLADRVASFGGSWTFIIFFASVLVVWITINSIAMLGKTFDPYPYILLNLVLSCLAALQAPVIMMSQNRQQIKDRLQADNDYRVNLKAELEIRHLHAKMDLLLTHQWQRLLEIQQVQTDLLEEIGNRK